MDHETLLETVLGAVMNTDAEPLSVIWTLRKEAPEARVMGLIRALLAADQVIASTFNGNSAGRPDAKLARTMALILAEAADDLEAEGTVTAPLRLCDLSI